MKQIVKRYPIEVFEIIRWPNGTVVAHLHQTVVFDDGSREQRHAWPPSSADTIEGAKEKVREYAEQGACIFRAYGNEPLLTPNQKFRYRGNMDWAYRDNHSQLVKKYDIPELDDDGNPQYRKDFFWRTPHEDMDYRGNGKVYIPGEFKDKIDEIIKSREAHDLSEQYRDEVMQERHEEELEWREMYDPWHDPGASLRW